MQLAQVQVEPQLQFSQVQFELIHGAFWVRSPLVVTFMMLFFYCYLITQK